MKSLRCSILENLDVTLKQKLLDLINSDSIDDKIARKMLHIASVVTIEQKTLIDTMMQQKGIGNTTSIVNKILNKHDQIDLLQHLASGEITLPDSDDFIKDTNIYNLISTKTGLIIDKDCLKELASLTIPTEKNITRGVFEILVQLFLSDIVDRNDSKYSPTGHGDVNTAKYTIEFKGPGARVMSQKGYTAKCIDEYIEEYLKKKGVKLKDLGLKLSGGGIFHAQKSIKEFFNSLSVYNMRDEELFDLTSKAILAMYEDHKTLNSGSFKFSFNSSKIQSHVFNNGKVNAKNVIRLMGCIQLSYYAKAEGYTHLCVFKGRDGKSALNSGEYKCFTGSNMQSVDYTFFEDSLEFFAGGKHDGTHRDNYCQIRYL